MSEDNFTPSKKNGLSLFFAVTVLFILMFLAAWFLPAGINLPAVVALFWIFFLIIGRHVTGAGLGFLVNELNVMSLARLQMAGWTAVVLGTYLTFVIARMKAGELDPLRVEIDWRLWSLLGISTASLLGAGLIAQTKKEKEPDPDFVADTEKITGDEKGGVEKNRQGTLYANSKPGDAQFTDLFQGDEIANTTRVDLGKVQMFFFTVVLLVVYVVMAANELYHPGDPKLSHLPLVPDGMVALLGISHAGYLGGKAVAHTPPPPK